MKNPVFFCIVSENYLPWARVWSQALQQHQPDVSAKVLLCASDSACRKAAGSGLDLLSMEPLLTPEVADMRRRQTQREFLSAVKPFAIRHLLHAGHSSVIYLDADILVTSALAAVLSTVANHAVTLTPHRLTPPPHGDRTLLLAGMFNAGFLGFSRKSEALDFVDWWASRLVTHCRMDIRQGMLLDQRWLDLAPALVEDLHCLRDPGCNVAYWNLDERPLTMGESGWLVGDESVKFFHFSGFQPYEPDDVSVFRPAWRVQDLGPEASLFRNYAALLRAAGWQPEKTFPWPWGPSCSLEARLRRRLGRLRDRTRALIQRCSPAGRA